uniref:Pleckstrin homology domain containing A4 n=1 Tax=Saimiri boliviensis boliviensis TaxID=39432 RepID=A0A2K6UHC3_SAIBB
MEGSRPRSSLSLASSVSTISSLSSLSPKDSSGLRLWKRRWFVLSGHCLFYYKDSREESVLGSVLLPSYNIRPDGPGAPRGRRFTFTGQPRSPARPQPGEGPGGPGGPPEVSRGEEGRISESPEVARLSRGRGRPRLVTPSPTTDLQPGLQIRRARSPDLFTPLSRPPSPLSLPRPRSAPARRPPAPSGDTARPHTPLSRIDVRPPLDWSSQRQTLSRPPTPRRGPPSEAGGGKPPRSPQHWSQEPRTQPGPPLESTFHQSLETDTLLTKLCGQDRLLRRLQEEIDQRQEEKEQLEAALELTRQQLGQATREAGAPGRAWGRQRLLQDRLVSVRAALCHLTQERERVWEKYSGLEQELGTLRETLEYLLHLGSPQDRVSAQQQLWMVEDTLAGLSGPQKPPPHTEPDSPSPVLQGEESSERESLPESLELSSPRSPETDWGRPPGGDKDLSSPPLGTGSPRVSQASSPEGRHLPSPQLGTKSEEQHPLLADFRRPPGASSQPLPGPGY